MYPQGLWKHRLLGPSPGFCFLTSESHSVVLESAASASPGNLVDQKLQERDPAICVFTSPGLKCEDCSPLPSLKNVWFLKGLHFICFLFYLQSIVSLRFFQGHILLTSQWTRRYWTWNSYQGYEERCHVRGKTQFDARYNHNIYWLVSVQKVHTNWLGNWEVLQNVREEKSLPLRQGEITTSMANITHDLHMWKRSLTDKHAFPEIRWAARHRHRDLLIITQTQDKTRAGRQEFYHRWVSNAMNSGLCIFLIFPPECLNISS